MNEKALLTIYAGIVVVAFALVSVVVIVSRRHPYFIAKKLRLGALLLTLTGAAAGCRGPTGPIVTCYDPAPPNRFIIDQADSSTGAVTLNRAHTDTLTGKIVDRTGTAFSYAVVDSHNTPLCAEDISARDGAFDERSEEFTIAIDESVVPGTYQLRFYARPSDSVESLDWHNGSFTLRVIEY